MGQQWTNIVNHENFLMFRTNLDIFLYDRNKNELSGYNHIINEKWDQPFSTYIPLDNTNKIICSIEDPSHIKHAVEHMSEERKADKRFSEILNVASKLTEENNPILFIYEFTD